MESNAWHFHPMAMMEYLNDGIHHCHEMMSKYEIHEKDGALERVLQVFHHYHKIHGRYLAFMETMEYWNDGIHH
jgi:hypothetical protein